MMMTMMTMAVMILMMMMMMMMMKMGNNSNNDNNNRNNDNNNSNPEGNSRPARQDSPTKKRKTEQRAILTTSSGPRCQSEPFSSHLCTGPAKVLVRLSRDPVRG